MFELELSPRAIAAIGNAELSWRDARSNEDQLARRSIELPQFAPTLAEAALPLQRATAVAAAAELLLGSYHVPPGVDRDDIMELAGSVDVALFDEPWRQQLLRILQSPPPGS